MSDKGDTGSAGMWFLTTVLAAPCTSAFKYTSEGAMYLQSSMDVHNLICRVKVSMKDACIMSEVL